MEQRTKSKSKTSKQELVDELWNISKNGSFRLYDDYRKENPLN